MACRGTALLLLLQVIYEHGEGWRYNTDTVKLIFAPELSGNPDSSHPVGKQ
jgi:hypothetical protein